MLLQILNSICPGWKKEYRFHPIRRWRFDFAHPEYKIAIEIEGGIATYGRHVRIQGYINDMEKYNEAQKLGWKVLRYWTKKKDINNIIRDIEYFVK